MNDDGRPSVAVLRAAAAGGRSYQAGGSEVKTLTLTAKIRLIFATEFKFVDILGKVEGGS